MVCGMWGILRGNRNANVRDINMYWRRLLRVPWTERRSNQSILKEISFGISLEGNRFKDIDLIDRVPDELWNKVRDIVQETGIKTIPMEKKCKKAKWLSGEALKIAVKRR